MASTSDNSTRGLSRRGFLLGAGAGLTAGVPLAWLGARAWPNHPAPTPPTAAPADAMPGPYPGRVVEVHHPDAVSRSMKTNCCVMRGMVNRGMCDLTGAELPRDPDEVVAADTWRRFFTPGDVVGIKVNPVGRAYNKRQTPAISSPALVVEVIEGLKSAGVRASDIILFERYADQFREAGYEALLRTRPMTGVRWYAAAAAFDDRQVDIEGYDRGQDRDPHVVGYDPDVFVHMAYAWNGGNGEDRKDDRRFRSHLTVVVSRMVNKVINLPVLKDHGSAGVTLALKNLSHGMNNNVCRSHSARMDNGDAASAPNQCNTFIPTAVRQPIIRQKTVLHILDGLIAVYDGGPACRCTWPYRSLLFATDPVAMDLVGWRIIDAQRAAEGLPPVARTGMQFETPALRVGSGLIGLSAQGPAEAMTLAAAYKNRLAVGEGLDRRQPEHIFLAGTNGLGVFDAARIDHRRVTIGA